MKNAIISLLALAAIASIIPIVSIYAQDPVPEPVQNPLELTITVSAEDLKTLTWAAGQNPKVIGQYATMGPDKTPAGMLYRMAQKNLPALEALRLAAEPAIKEKDLSLKIKTLSAPDCKDLASKLGVALTSLPCNK